MKIDRVHADGAIVLIPRERVDTKAASSFEEVTLDAVRAARRVVIDFSEIDYISSAGLRVVVMAAKQSRAAGRTCALCSLRPEVLKVFETTGLSRILTIFSDRAAALEAG